MPIILKIKRQEERKKVKSLKNKKVTRKNKHIKTRIIASGLALVTMSGIFLGMTKKKTKTETSNSQTVSYMQFVDEVEENEDKFVVPTNVSQDAVKPTNLSNNQQQITKETTPLSEKKESNNLNIVSISYEDRTETPKAINAESNYKNVIEKYSKIYGLDAKLMLALATQERGVHSPNLDKGSAIGLMQIEKKVWDNGKLKAYNFQTKQYETITVNLNSLSNLDYNVKVGCMIFQECLKNANYNPLIALQTYNMGYGNMNRVLANYCVDSKKTKEEVLKNYNDVAWMNCRDIIDVGDKSYIEHVLSYYGDNIKITNTKPDGTEASININNKESKKIY